MNNNSNLKNVKESPIEITCNGGIVGKFICWNKSILLGYKHKFEDEVDFFRELAYKYNPDKVEELEKDLRDNEISFDHYVGMVKNMVYNNDEIYILPLFLYECNEITITTTGFGSD